MSKTVTVSWTNQTPATAAGVPTTTIVSITGGPAAGPAIPPQSIPFATLSAVFLAVPEEAETDPDYTASVQTFDNSTPPVAIGPIGTMNFSVLAPAPVLVAGNVSVAVS